MLVTNHFNSSLFALHFAVQQAASRIDVLPAAGSNGGRNAMLRQVVSQPNHLLLGRALVWRIRYLVEANQVYAAFYWRKQSNQLSCMPLRVVETPEDDVLEAESALMAPVLLAKQSQQIF